MLWYTQAEKALIREPCDYLLKTIAALIFSAHALASAYEVHMYLRCMVLFMGMQRTSCVRPAPPIRVGHPVISCVHSHRAACPSIESLNGRIVDTCRPHPAMLQEDLAMSMCCFHLLQCQMSLIEGFLHCRGLLCYLQCIRSQHTAQVISDTCASPIRQLLCSSYATHVHGRSCWCKYDTGSKLAYVFAPCLC